MESNIEFDCGFLYGEPKLGPEDEMVVDALVSKTIEAVYAWYAKNKNNKERAQGLLRELRRLIGKPALHLEMSKEYTWYSYKTFRSYLQSDIERLDDFLALNGPELKGDLMRSVSEFRDYLVEFVALSNRSDKASQSKLDPLAAGIREYVEETTAKIDDLLAEQ